MILGIDPGSAGGWVYRDGGVTMFGALPFTGKEFNAVHFSHIVRGMSKNTIGVVEYGQAFQKSSKASMFKQGQTYGTIIGILAASGLRYELVQSKAWKKIILAGYADKNKEAAIAYVTRAFPHIDLTNGGRHRPHDGVADAACICEFGFRQYGSNQAPTSGGGT